MFLSLCVIFMYIFCFFLVQFVCVPGNSRRYNLRTPVTQLISSIFVKLIFSPVKTKKKENDEWKNRNQKNRKKNNRKIHTTVKTQFESINLSLISRDTENTYERKKTNISHSCLFFQKRITLLCLSFQKNNVHYIGNPFWNFQEWFCSLYLCLTINFCFFFFLSFSFLLVLEPTMIAKIFRKLQFELQFLRPFPFSLNFFLHFSWLCR